MKNVLNISSKNIKKLIKKQRFELILLNIMPEIKKT